MGKRNLQAIEARRIERARLLKHNLSQAEVARHLQVSRQAVSVWVRQLAEANGALGRLKEPILRKLRGGAAASLEKLATWKSPLASRWASAAG